MKPLLVAIATYLFTFESQELKTPLFELILKGEPPRTFYDTNPIDLKEECRKLSSSIRLEWIPPSLWQLGALHAFFHNPTIRDGILACSGPEWDPLTYERTLHHRLVSACSIEEIVSCFDQHSRSLPHLSELFFQVNQSIVALYHRAGRLYTEMLHLAISELPPFSIWREKGFPFWKSPWIYNPKAADIFYSAITDRKLFAEILNIEELAHENGEWVLYRGYPGLSFPSTIQIGHTQNHALSFGSTLLGGCFFSLEASAMTYAKPETSKEHSFLALRVPPKELRDLFRIGPLHPFLQLLVDGEMFHAHTKVAAKSSDEYASKPIEGYFMKRNKYCIDPIDYIITTTMTSEELEKSFHQLCEKSGFISFYVSLDVPCIFSEAL